MTDSIECDILSLSPDGRGVARPEGERGPVAFVADALPGQRVRARIVRRRTRHLEAAAVDLLRPAPDAVPPICPHAGACGGCPLQTMPEAAQLAAKTDFIRQALRRIGGLDGIPVADAIPSPLTRRFRNRMEFAFGPAPDGGMVLGQRRRGDHAVIAVPGCALLPAWALAPLARLSALAEETGLPAHIPPGRRESGHGGRRGAGFWRCAAVRLDWRGGAPDVDAVSAEPEPDAWRIRLRILTSPGGSRERRMVRRVAERLLEDEPAVAAVIHEERSRSDALSAGERRVFALGAMGTLGGDAEPALLRQPLAGRIFLADIASFFQTNTSAAQILAMLAAALIRGERPDTAAGLRTPDDAGGPESLLDLCCGVGAPGLVCAGADTRLEGVELDARAAELARRNAAALGRPNAAFRCGDMAALAQSLPPTETILADPPRAGLPPETAAALRDAPARRLVHISCNPATLARDAAILAETWTPILAAPADLFPHTPHVESVMLWERRPRTGA